MFQLYFEVSDPRRNMSRKGQDYRGLYFDRLSN